MNSCRFVVDGEWQLLPDKPTEKTEVGIVNNVIKTPPNPHSTTDNVGTTPGVEGTLTSSPDPDSQPLIPTSTPSEKVEADNTPMVSIAELAAATGVSEAQVENWYAKAEAEDPTTLGWLPKSEPSASTPAPATENEQAPEQEGSSLGSKLTSILPSAITEQPLVQSAKDLLDAPSSIVPSSSSPIPSNDEDASHEKVTDVDVAPVPTATTSEEPVSVYVSEPAASASEAPAPASDVNASPAVEAEAPVLVEPKSEPALDEPAASEDKLEEEPVSEETPTPTLSSIVAAPVAAAVAGAAALAGVGVGLVGEEKVHANGNGHAVVDEGKKEEDSADDAHAVPEPEAASESVSAPAPEPVTEVEEREIRNESAPTPAEPTVDTPAAPVEDAAEAEPFKAPIVPLIDDSSAVTNLLLADPAAQAEHDHDHEKEASVESGTTVAGDEEPAPIESAEKESAKEVVVPVIDETSTPQTLPVSISNPESPSGLTTPGGGKKNPAVFDWSAWGKLSEKNLSGALAAAPAVVAGAVGLDVGAEKATTPAATEPEAEAEAVKVKEPEVAPVPEVLPEELPILEQTPGVVETPAVADVPVVEPEAIPEAPEELPVLEETPGVVETSAVEGIPVVDAVPEAAEEPEAEVETSLPILEETPGAVETPAVSEVPVVDATPAPEPEAVLEALPVLDETPGVVKTSAVEALPIVEAPVVAAEEPTTVTNEKPFEIVNEFTPKPVEALEEPAAVEDAGLPVLEETPGIQETPAIEDVPVADEVAVPAVPEDEEISPAVESEVPPPVEGFAVAAPSGPIVEPEAVVANDVSVPVPETEAATESSLEKPSEAPVEDKAPSHDIPGATVAAGVAVALTTAAAAVAIEEPSHSSEPEPVPEVNAVVADEPGNVETEKDIPVLDETPGIQETPAVEEAPVVASEEPAIVDDAAPLEKELPVLEETPGIQETPAVEAVPVESELPVLQETPGIQETPEVEAVPVAAQEEPAVTKEATPGPVVEEQTEKELPVLEQTPGIQISGLVGQIPVETELPVVQETPGIQETHVVEEAPIAEEAPVPEHPSTSTAEDVSPVPTTAEALETVVPVAAVAASSVAILAHEHETEPAPATDAAEPHTSSPEDFVPPPVFEATQEPVVESAAESVPVLATEPEDVAEIEPTPAHIEPVEEIARVADELPEGAATALAAAAAGAIAEPDVVAAEEPVPVEPEPKEVLEAGVAPEVSETVSTPVRETSVEEISTSTEPAVPENSNEGQLSSLAEAAVGVPIVGAALAATLASTSKLYVAGLYIRCYAY